MGISMPTREYTLMLCVPEEIYILHRKLRSTYKCTTQI